MRTYHVAIVAALLGTCIMGNQFGDEATRQIGHVIRAERAQPRRTRLHPQPSTVPGDRHIRWGKTTTNDEFPTYPTSGNTVVVELGDYVYDDSDVGDRAVTWEAYDPPEYRIARTFDGSLPAEGTEVPLQLHHGRWWIVPAKREYEGIVYETDGIDFDSYGEVTIYKAGVSTLVNVDVYYEWIEWASNLPNGTKVRFVWDHERDHYSIRQHECV